MKKNIIKLIVLYILGFLLYSAVLSITQSLILNTIGITRDEIDIVFDNPIANIVFYTMLFSFITLMLYAYDKTSAKELKIALIEMKERVKTNEEKLRENRNDNNYSSSGGTGSV